MRACLLLAAQSLILPAGLAAQARVLADPMPQKAAESNYAGARLMKSGVASQFDSLGDIPMGRAGDSVTVYLFPDGNNMGRTVHAKITRRQRFAPPTSWRAACDEVAHPGWFYALTPASRALFAVVVPGVFPKPEVRPVPPAARDGAWQFYHAVADSSWQRYLAFRKLTSERAIDYQHADFWGSKGDARWSVTKMFGVRGPNGHNYAALAFAMRDDYPDAPNTARTWIIDSWGYPVGSVVGNVDIYGTVDDHGVDAVVTSSGLIRWDGTQWRFPSVYSEEPCLYHKTMPLPPGAHP
ncbi:MAG TPA: hypothetical protein VID74_09655 [Gemmatimonadales bacterium]